jgi:hypothetical protein
MPVIELSFSMPVADRHDDEINIREKIVVASKRLSPGCRMVGHRGQVRVIAQ